MYLKPNNEKGQPKYNPTWAVTRSIRRIKNEAGNIVAQHDLTIPYNSLGSIGPSGQTFLWGQPGNQLVSV